MRKMALGACLALMATIVSGCKIAVMVVEGGEVHSDAYGVCGSGELCVHELTDSYLSERFRAMPEPGWRFLHWQDGDGFFCAGSGGVSCLVSGADLGNDGVLAAVLASDRVAKLMPVFQRKSIPGPDIVGAAILDTIKVAENEWAQPRLFLGLSYEEIAEVCPEGVCVGALNGYDMDGWTWADRLAVNALFNHYIGLNILNSETYEAYEEPGFWSIDFRKDGWNYSDTSFSQADIRTTGYYLTPDDGGFNTASMMQGGRQVVQSRARTDLNKDPAVFEHWVGAWVYRAAGAAL